MAFRILVADDHEIVRHGVCAVLRARKDWELCQATDGREAVTTAKQMRPDIVILDIGMPNLNGLAAARQILRDNPDQKIIILTIDESDQLVDELLKAGVRGYVLKSDAACDLVLAVEALSQKKTFFTPRVAQRVLTGFLGHNPGKSGAQALPMLTPRELEVVQLLAEGKSTKEVATTLDLSVKTAETHRNNIMRKLDVHNLCDVVLYAVRNHIVQFSKFDSPINSAQAPF